MKRQFLAGSHRRNEIYIMDGSGHLVWSHPAINPQDLWMLPDGSIAFTWKNGVRRIRRDGSVLFDFSVPPPNEIPCLQKLPQNGWLIGIVGLCELLEIRENGEECSRLKLSTSASNIHSQFRLCRKTFAGSYLVPFTAEGALREYAPDGKVIWELTGLPAPVCAIRTAAGDTLVSMEGSVRRYAPDYHEIWRFSGDDVPDIDFAIAAGVQLLSSGNILFANWGSCERNGKRAVHILEVSPAKEVVWQCDSPLIGNVAQCQLLNEDFSISEECILR